MLMRQGRAACASYSIPTRIMSNVLFRRGLALLKKSGQLDNLYMLGLTPSGGGCAPLQG